MNPIDLKKWKEEYISGKTYEAHDPDEIARVLNTLSEGFNGTNMLQAGYISALLWVLKDPGAVEHMTQTLKDITEILELEKSKKPKT